MLRSADELGAVELPDRSALSSPDGEEDGSEPVPSSSALGDGVDDGSELLGDELLGDELLGDELLGDEVLGAELLGESSSSDSVPSVVFDGALDEVET
ncbi:hypothetical protein ACLFMI_01725 [Pseudonocardia nantongensis]|uniref:hypothetical protein n=1 Tax=Pseudonocardia nantongensis TaxID=1181885 RepID=UPI00397B1A5B